MTFLCKHSIIISDVTLCITPLHQEDISPIERVNTQGGIIMAKFEHEGYCPFNSVRNAWDQNTDTRLIGLWSLIGASIVYEREDENEDESKCIFNTAACDQIFGTDVIAYDVLSAIIKKNANADKIKVLRFTTERTTPRRPLIFRRLWVKLPILSW